MNRPTRNKKIAIRKHSKRYHLNMLYQIEMNYYFGTSTVNPNDSKKKFKELLEHIK